MRRPLAQVAKMDDPLAIRVQKLAPELFDEIFDLVFTLDDDPSVILTHDYKPPPQLQVDRASRATFAATYYPNTAFCLASVAKKSLLSRLSVASSSPCPSPPSHDPEDAHHWQPASARRRFLPGVRIPSRFRQLSLQGSQQVHERRAFQGREARCSCRGEASCHVFGDAGRRIGEEVSRVDCIAPRDELR
ncbi:hypothetical protein M409DRAFT_58094 [Zasmidium cellare ATCC 36951]|uniref:Uncharacterized protein n=1 Tax=Zasmidium cellare ATCC 36951 TaxID=1080233 RepID=A0A6A6C9V7_ZASCE|nr:uncharacterized protein M409DRAFT_58094 [Zasmidium cellare ATCC 36951]KAF2162682.1 hypothetical protein M409DRAFT_58094 [Zasmidium cellare ATCC 36951]